MVTDLFTAYSIVGILFCAAFGLYFSIESVWNKHFSKIEVYLKAGEYGESEQKVSWSLWKEPLNAWTSLAYSFFGFLIFFTGITDYFYTPSDPINIIASNASFSLLFGVSCIYLGMASFLFHASHHEVWRKADAGMTSGVAVVPFVYGIYAHATLPSTTSLAMTILAIIFQLSLTHGYLPYGSSDILLPSLIGFSWILELIPRYAGILHQEQCIYWLECFYYAIGGMLLRATDIKRKTSTSTTILKGYAVLTIVFGIFLGVTNVCLWIGILAGIYVYCKPEKGHICWHLASSFALFRWWFLLRTRTYEHHPYSKAFADSLSNTPYVITINTILGNNDSVPSIDDSTTIGIHNYDFEVYGIIFCIIIRNSLRRLAMINTYLSTEFKSKIISCIEHIIFTAYASQLLLQDKLGLGSLPTGVTSAVSTQSEVPWIPVFTINAWILPVFPTSQFHLFYMVRVACLIEEYLYTCTSIVLSILHPTDDNKYRNYKNDIHSVTSAALAFFSYFMGYAKFGMLVTFLHDVTDIPLDLYNLSTLLHLHKWIQKSLLGFTIYAWASWRLYYFPTYLLYSVIYESKSQFFTSLCQPTECKTLYDIPERVPFLGLLIVLYILHILWTIQMISKLIYNAPVSDLWILQSIYKYFNPSSTTTSATSSSTGLSISISPSGSPRHAKKEEDSRISYNEDDHDHEREMSQGLLSSTHTHESSSSSSGIKNYI